MEKGNQVGGLLVPVKCAMSPEFFTPAVFEGEIEEHLFETPFSLHLLRSKGKERFVLPSVFPDLGSLPSTSSFPDFTLRLAILCGKVEGQPLLS